MSSSQSLRARAPAAFGHITQRLARPYTRTPARFMAYKDSENRDSIKTGNTEQTKTGRDTDVAESESAFDPSRTSPESEKERAGKPLDVSGANQNVSKPRGDEKSKKESGAGKETAKGGASQRSTPQKKGSK